MIGRVFGAIATARVPTGVFQRHRVYRKESYEGPPPAPWRPRRRYLRPVYDRYLSAWGFPSILLILLHFVELCCKWLLHAVQGKPFDWNAPPDGEDAEYVYNGQTYRMGDECDDQPGKYLDYLIDSRWPYVFMKPASKGRLIFEFIVMLITISIIVLVTCGMSSITDNEIILPAYQSPA